MNNNYETVMWLEIHIKLNSTNKLFCRCKNEQEFDNLQPNTNICPVCTWQPWALPVLSLEPLEKAVALGLALNCQVNEVSMFDRKSYFYPDLPMWYQITQLYKPTNIEWKIKFFVDNYQKEVEIRIKQAHIEADAWKTVHEGWKAYLDFNRAWTPLVEIVTYPDFRSEEEVIEFLKELQRIVRYNNIWYADLEKWQLRCDVNISVKKKWDKKLWTKVELKNMNSFSAIKSAIEHERKRQIRLLESWQQVDQETRWWNDAKKTSYTMRSKEEALDYRYFPEPDLPPLKLEKQFIDNIRKTIVESPFQKAKRYKEKYWFHKEFITPLIQNIKIANYFERLVNNKIKPKTATKWVVNMILRHLNENKTDIEQFPIKYEYIQTLLQKIDEWQLIENQAKQVYKEMLETWKDPKTIIKEKWFKPQNTEELESIVKKVLDNNPKVVEDIKNWKTNAIWFLIWQVMRETAWSANPKQVNKLINQTINN